jgi:SAM-dependent methyltransferase
MKGELDYLCVDQFLTHFLATQALGTAFALGLIDRLERGGPPDVPGAHPKMLRTLLGLLRENGVLAGDTLSDGFRRALSFRELLLAKIDFANLAASDLLRGFPALIRQPAEFMQQSDMFRLFAYGRGVDPTPENLRHTAQWMNITTALTRHEAAVALNRHDFGAHRRMLDLGGNSGEFALQACRRHPPLHATIFDLPVVCEIGRRHIAHEPEAPRLNFVAGNALRDPLPADHDLITIKSVLHDWPDAEAAVLLARAREALAPGGTLLVFERCAAPVSAADYAACAHLPFAHCYREPEHSRALIEAAGFHFTSFQIVQLETPFILATATLH